MLELCFILSFCIAYAIFLKVIGMEMFQDRCYFIFAMVTILIITLWVTIYSVVVVTNQEITYIATNHCTYTGRVDTSYMPVTVQSGQTTIVTMQAVNDYHWMCHGKDTVFSVGPG